MEVNSSFFYFSCPGRSVRSPPALAIPAAAATPPSLVCLGGGDPSIFGVPRRRRRRAAIPKGVRPASVGGTRQDPGGGATSAPTRRVAASSLEVWGATCSEVVRGRSPCPKLRSPALSPARASKDGTTVKAGCATPFMENT
jgi:hypothetical protein